jgi:PBSX family phage terminase large subunit
MISEKQKKILAFPYTKYDALICDGAVRSGKTSIMMWAFVRWAMDNFSGQRFGICGKTVDSATKNIVVPFTSMSLAKERYIIRWRRSEKILEVRRGAVTNLFEVFGGKDESSFTLIQGRTLAGVLLDEVVLMPRSFVEQAMTRCSVDGAKLWFSCNPGSPQHWFYVEWIQRHNERNALYLHFKMTDNPGLSAKTLERYEAMFTGIFRQRYIDGLWVLAEGLIYPMFGNDSPVPTIKREYSRYVISMDYGIQNPTAMQLWGFCDGVWYQVDEFYHSGRETNRQKTDQEYYEDLERLAGDRYIEFLIIDPSAASFITLVKQKRRFRVKKANNDVIPGIQKVASAHQQGKIKVNDCCKRTIKEYGLYSWDQKDGEDRPIKDNDHAMDATRYFVSTMNIMKIKSDYVSLLD